MEQDKNNRGQRPYNNRPRNNNRNNNYSKQSSGRRYYQPPKYKIETLPDVIMYPFHIGYKFMKKEIAGGLMLVLAAIFALWMANSAYAESYASLLHVHLSVAFGSWHAEAGLQHFVNDALMAVFFLLVGLEIKYEFKEGELASRAQAILPFVAAICGMAVPALFYIAINAGDPSALRGWAIPAATDIAFAIGIIALLGKRAPTSLKVLLVAIAVIDDLGAILVIAIFYNNGLDYNALLIALGIFLVMLFMNRRGIALLTPYMVLGLLLWIVIFRSGIHATLAGVLTALTIPLHPGPHSRSRRSPLKALEHNISPWVNFTILPIFAFMNAGVSLDGMMGADSSMMKPISLGIICGLFFGKQIGIFSAIYGMYKLKLASLPAGANWLQVYAMATLCGIGFTMSLFIGGLAFPGGEADAQVRIGVFTASVASALFGYIIFFVVSKRNPQQQNNTGRRPQGNRRPNQNQNRRNNYNNRPPRRNPNRSGGGGGNAGGSEAGGSDTPPTPAATS